MEKKGQQQYGYIAICVVATLLNTTVIYLFLTKRYLRKMYSNIFLFSLAISDLCYAAIVVPLLVKCERSSEEPPPVITCYAYAYLMVFFGYSTVYHIVLGIAEKLCAICFTLKHHSMFSRSIAIKLSLSVWVVSIVLSHIPAWWDYILPGSGKENFQRDNAFHQFNFATAFALPVLLSAIMYAIILHKIFTTANVRLTEDNSRRSRLYSEKKAAFTFAVMLAAFLFSWSTWFLARIHNEIGTGDNMYYFVTFSKLLDPIFNPLLYTFLKNDFRRAFFSLFTSKRRKDELLRMRLTRMKHGTGLYTHEDTLRHTSIH